MSAFVINGLEFVDGGIFKLILTNFIMGKDEYGLIWMSAGNSYFKEDIVLKLLRFASKHFPNVLILSPDEPAEHTFLALDYEHKVAKRKAKLNANLLQNRAKRAVEILTAEGIKTPFNLIEWKNIIPNKKYQEMLKEINLLYQKNKHFQKDARDVTKNVIGNKLKKDLDNEKAIDEAVNYLLKELAFVLVSPIIYNASQVTYIYHHEWPIYQRLIAGEYDSKPKGNLNFLQHDIN